MADPDIDKRVQERTQQREKAAEEVRKIVQEQSGQREQHAVAYDQHRAQARPTPTQVENDLAALGHPVVEKEDDQAGEDLVVVRQLVPATEAGSYQTRDLSGTLTGAQQVQRGGPNQSQGQPQRAPTPQPRREEPPRQGG